MDDKYECDYCTAAFDDISGLEEHIVEHLTISEEDFEVLKNLIQHPENNQKGGNGNIPLSHKMKSSVESHRSVILQKNQTTLVSQRGSSHVKGIESRIHERRSIPCCICGHALILYPNIHTKLASKQVLMEYQCTACSLFFETMETLKNHSKDGSCKDINNILKLEVNFSALTSKNTSSGLSQNEKTAYQAVRCGKMKNCSYKCGKCEELCADFSDWLVHEETHINMHPFTCVICHTNFSTYRSYAVHIEKHHYSNGNIGNQLQFALECKKCHLSFGSAWDLLMHDRLIHIDLYPFKCFTCSKKYGKMASLRYHKRRCHLDILKEKKGQNIGYGEITKPETIFNQALIKFRAIFCKGNKLENDIVCPVCKKKEDSFSGLTHHLAGHLGFLQCIYCNVPFKKNITLESQMPCNSKPFACQQCQQSPEDKEILADLVYKKIEIGKYDHKKYHMYPKKRRKVSVLCEICGVMITERHIYRHKKTHKKPSLTDIDLHCPKCNSLFESLFQLKIHVKRHHESSDKLQCKFCSKLLSSKATLDIHVLKCHSEKEAKFECFECKKKFVCKRDLNKHSNIHMSESKPYKCDQCDAAFAQNCNLTKHKIIHTGKRPYKCDKCDAAFAHRSNLNKHSHIHTGKYPLRCNICNRGFDRMKDLTMHRKSNCNSLSQYLK